MNTRKLLTVWCLVGMLSCAETSRMVLLRSSLAGEVYRYTAAHGSGSGLVLRVAIPEGWAGAIGFDSLDIRGHLLPCRLTDGGRTLEANWFVPAPEATASVPDRPETRVAVPLPGPGELLPAHVLAHRKGRPVRIPIGTFTEQPAR